MRKQRFDLGGERNQRRRRVVAQRPHAKRVTAEDEPLSDGIEHTEREIAHEALDEVLVPLLVGGERARRIARARWQIQQAIELLSIVEPAVEDDQRSAIARKRLSLADFLERDPEMLVREAYGAGNQGVFAIGAAVRERLAHAAQDRRVRWTSVPVPHADDAAQIVLRPRALSERRPARV